MEYFIANGGYFSVLFIEMSSSGAGLYCIPILKQYYLRNVRFELCMSFRFIYVIWIEVVKYAWKMCLWMHAYKLISKHNASICDNVALEFYTIICYALHTRAAFVFMWNLKLHTKSGNRAPHLSEGERRNTCRWCLNFSTLATLFVESDCIFYAL